MTRPHYDGKAETWRQVYASGDPYARRIQRRREAVVAAVQKQTSGRPARILDVGCGTGEVARRLSALGHRVVGVELSREMLAEASGVAAEGPPGPGYVRGSALELPVRPASFEGAVCAGVLEHLMRRRVEGRVVDSAAIALHEMARAVAPGGFLVITGANLARLHWLLDPRQLWSALGQRRRGRLLEGQAGAPASPGSAGLSPVELSFTRRWTPGELRRFLAGEDLGIADWTGIGFGPFTLLGRHLLSHEHSVALSARLERASQRKGFRLLGRFAATWILTLMPGDASRAGAGSSPSAADVP